VTFDILITGGRVLDGAGNPPFRADVGIRDGLIPDIGRLSGASAAHTIAAEGLVVCPGFIDMHCHSDLQILVHPPHEAKVCQGVTVDVLGQDGLSYAPVTDEVLAQLRTQLRGWNSDPTGFDWSWRTVAGYLDRLDGSVAINTAYLVPHGTLRMIAMGQEDRSPSGEELAHMKGLLAEGLEQGAVGLSAGLTYTPAMYASDDELVALCEVVAAYGAFYCPHHRNYGSRALEAYASCIEIARRSGAALHLAHAHLGFAINKGKGPRLLEMLAAARRAGIDVTLDTYPYLAGSTYLHAVLPGWVQAGGRDETLAKLSDPGLRARLRTILEEEGSDGFQGVPIDWEAIVISGVEVADNERFVGSSVSRAAATEGRSPFDFFCDLLIDDQLGVSCVQHIGNEDNVRTIMTDPGHMAGSDGILVGSRPHPRAWGTFPRYLARYVRELGVLTLEQAVRKMTSLPAQRLGFLERGLLRPRMAADVVCFDPDTVRDTATYEDPKRLPEGIPYVICNGRVVVDEGRHTGELAGRALRRR
jgi:N-acyl-D-amino-acid deacylase